MTLYNRPGSCVKTGEKNLTRDVEKLQFTHNSSLARSGHSESAVVVDGYTATQLRMSGSYAKARSS